MLRQMREWRWIANGRNRADKICFMHSAKAELKRKIYRLPSSTGDSFLFTHSSVLFDPLFRLFLFLSLFRTVNFSPRIPVPLFFDLLHHTLQIFFIFFSSLMLLRCSGWEKCWNFLEHEQKMYYSRARWKQNEFFYLFLWMDYSLYPGHTQNLAQISREWGKKTAEGWKRMKSKAVDCI